MSTQEIKVPDLGNANQVSVIEVLVKPGDVIQANDNVVTLEGDKATMEIPATTGGKIMEVLVKVGDKVTTGSSLLRVVGENQAPQAAKEPAPAAAKESSTTTSIPAAPSAPATAVPTMSAPITSVSSSTIEIYAGPGVRRLAREFGIDLKQVAGTGRKERITKEDVQAYVKTQLAKAQNGSGAGGTGIAIAPMPAIDFSQFGPIDQQPLNKIKRLTGINLHRNWVTVPHVTQFDEVDITELEAFRQGQKAEADTQGVKLTPLVFIMKAVVAALKAYPIFNSSLDPSGEALIMKKYFHLGIAVDTPNGLVVPVVRDVDQKGMFQLAAELAHISQKARDKGLTTQEMSGSCFTISSLGGIGGTAFTPIVNAPDVAILGISKAQMKPVYQSGNFIPRLMLPLSLSYDHRVVDGADGARFIGYLNQCLSDIRKLLL